MSPERADGFTELGKRKKGQYIEKLHAEIAKNNPTTVEESKEALSLVQTDETDTEQWFEFITKAYN